MAWSFKGCSPWLLDYVVSGPQGRTSWQGGRGKIPPYGHREGGGKKGGRKEGRDIEEGPGLDTFFKGMHPGSASSN